MGKLSGASLAENSNVSAAAQAALGAAALAPSVANRYITANETQALSPLTSILKTQVLHATDSVQVVPAAPAGFVNVLALIANESLDAGGVTAGLRITDGGVERVASSGAGAGPNTTLPGSLATPNEVRLYCPTLYFGVAAVGTEVGLAATHVLVPTSQMITWNKVLTGVIWETVAELTPPAGRQYKVPTLFGVNVGATWIFNMDSATTTIACRVTRGGKTFYLNSGSPTTGVAVGTRNMGGIFTANPVFLPGDLVEVRAVLAPVTAGAVIVGGVQSVVSL